MICLIYQTITTPDGLIFSLYGPEVGRRHDVTLSRERGIQERLQPCHFINRRQFSLYTDAAYMFVVYLLSTLLVKYSEQDGSKRLTWNAENGR